MEVRIGVQNVAREITFESEQTADEVRAVVTAALAGGEVLTLVDDKGRLVIVPTRALGYVHLGESEKSRFGFGTS
ncbi:MAG TPA: DUF3107 domain-containing protein [Candidatus Lustribacter sp.]|nr:DUF3107 domain-containing protein [Candidatus Lustribacter sp.]